MPSKNSSQPDDSSLNNLAQEKAERLKKAALLLENKITPYAARFAKKDSAADALQKPLGSKVKTAGRLVLLRDMGKITFAHLQDFSGRLQVVFRLGEIAEKDYKLFLKTISLGDFIGVEGETFKTHKGETSVLVKKYTFLSKALRPLPEKFHGLKDIEQKYRRRYLDLLMNEETRNVFQFRSAFIAALRQFYFAKGFTELDTPILCNTASGALAKPFQTHHNALDMDVYLRIAPEIFLKEAIVGGYEKIFEVARCFRNEGIDPSHLQDFSMIEHYCAYWNFEDNMAFTEEMFKTVIKKLKQTLKLEILNREGQAQEVDFATPWPRVTFRELLIKDCGIDIEQFTTAEALLKEIKQKKIVLEDAEKLGRGNLIDVLYKTVSRPKIINPTFLINHPIDLSPLARKNDQNPQVADRFQLIVNGWEVVNAYSELIDPVDQKERFEQQMKARQKGDEEAMQKDEEYIEAMEYGMPPISGWGMGIERVVALLTNQPNLRDVVLFPLMKPKKEDE